jgi:hypothetical protein
MTFVRIVFLSLAVLLPTAWTVARAADEPPAGDKSSETKSSKKSKKKSKKGEGDKTDTEKKGEEPK